MISTYFTTISVQRRSLSVLLPAPCACPQTPRAQTGPAAAAPAEAAQLSGQPAQHMHTEKF